MLILRAVIAVVCLWFIATGVSFAWSRACRSLVWRSSRSNRTRNLTATCHDIVSEGSTGQGLTASVSIVAGLMLLIVSFAGRRSSESES